ncbi:cell division protein SepF [Dethiosulfovibrio sp. F2B]|uniref:cell division protein SepF n=1 Tax=Dethiosulfovibrio faecalis TaxID=2720018 RepID=UPI001F327DEF|nr:cell division protein SepF [Dethiosulfovibrio faecalis]MCF4150764.1 cell division protein SepF [Dethiosulfovibrio faecalis]
MLNRLFELLGMTDDYDDDEIVITSHKEDGVGEAPPAVETSREERLDRIMRPLPPKAEVVLCRGADCLELKDDLLSALRQGRLILIDLQGVDLDLGNELLAAINEVIAASKGSLLRVSRSSFLATPVKTACEEWVAGEERQENSGD